MLTGGRGSEALAIGAVAELAARAGELLLEQGLGAAGAQPGVAGPDGAVGARRARAAYFRAADHLARDVLTL